MSRADVAFVCIASYALLATRTTDTGTLATGEWAGKVVCSLACCLAQRVLGRATGEVGDALLELERVCLVGGWDLVDLVWRFLACDQSCIVSMSAGMLPAAPYQMAHG